MLPALHSRPEDVPLSIAPPSDIILDVAQAADPLKLQAAQTKLAQTASGAAGAPDFAATLAAAAGSRGSASARPAPGLAGSMPHRTLDPHASTSQKFEAMVLQSFIENILPKNSDLFGDDKSAGMARSLFAEQIATQLARSGRLGIAKSLDRIAAQHAAAPAAKPDA